MRVYNRYTRGFTLVSLLSGIVASSILLLTVAQMASMSTRSYARNQKIISFYINARTAVQFMRETVPMAGFGIRQPVPERQTAYANLNGSAVQGGPAALPEWNYVGDYSGFGFTGSALYYEFASASSDSIPERCAEAVSSGYPDRQFFGLTDANRCYFVNDSSAIARNPEFNPASPSQTDWVCCNTAGTDACTAPFYSCGVRTGGSARNLPMATYQKLRRHVEVTDNGAGGDALTVYFTNLGPSDIVTFAGTTLAPVPAQPSYVLYSYTMRVDNAEAVLQAVDSDGTVHNVASNVEYMKVLVGESDRILDTVVNGQTNPLPEMNRYVSYDTANLYPYRISSVRVSLVASSEDDVLTSVPADLDIDLGLGDGSVYTAASDRKLRQPFVSTIFLNGYVLPSYQAYCAANGGQFRVKIGGIPFQNWTDAKDQCCDCTDRGWDACEAKRMEGAC